MYENTINPNPYPKQAENRIGQLDAFLRKAKDEAVEPPSDSAYVNSALNGARNVLLGHAKAMELFQKTGELYQGMRARGVSDLQAQAYLFSTGVDLAVRGMAPFLNAASDLIKKLMHSARLNILAERIQEIFDHLSPEDVNRLMEYLKQTPMASGISEKKLRRKLDEILKEKTYFIGTEVEAHAEALKNFGYAESDIPGYLLVLGYMAGLVTSKVLPGILSEP